jgi:hypothetical protein
MPVIVAPPAEGLVVGFDDGGSMFGAAANFGAASAAPGVEFGKATVGGDVDELVGAVAPGNSIRGGLLQFGVSIGG